ncbi:MULTISPECIES: non-ribosomal peptide synthase/polyketide synthase [unclassified Pseudomonas]|uniref:non-ribosomal peptide synthase/polyketide synthase n=4 Tax=Pseudomonas TaxID=286 RepID=UPI0031330183
MELVQRFIGLPSAQRKLFLEKLASKGMSLAQLPIPQTRQNAEWLPLSYAQQRQWFLWQLEPQSSAYNIPAALRFSGELDIAALQRSFEVLIGRHEILRTTFSLEDEQAVQVVHASLKFELAVESVASQEPGILQACLEAEARQPFDLQHGPLLRAKLLKLAPQEHVLVLTLHHIVADGWSMPVMVEDLLRLYEGASQGHDIQLPPLPIQYADYAIWQRAWMEAGEKDRQLEYWQAQLGDEQPVLELPTDRPRPALHSQQGARLEIPLPAELTSSLKRLAQQQGVTPFMLLLASFQTLLHRYSGQSDIRVGVPIANRNRVETERLAGFFVNTQVLRAEFGLNITFAELLEQVRQRALGAQAHQDLPFEQLVEALQPERSLSLSPLFQVMYNHQSQTRQDTARTLPGLVMEELAWGSHIAKFDLALDTFDHESGISAALTYATDLFDAPTIERMAAHWVNLLASIVTQPNQPVAGLSMLDGQELQRVLRDWNSTQADYHADQCMHQLFETQAKATPDAPALLFAEQELSYAQLNERANQLAHRLRQQGVGPDVLVGIAMERTPDMVVGLLAILKAGGAYVPLDPEYPQDRIEYMLKDSQSILLLSQSHLLARMPEEFHARTLLLDQLSLASYPTTDPVCITQPGNLAYSIYTSGSTGKPKGVLIEHRNVTALIGWAHGVYSQQDLCGVLASTSICFDLSVWELFVTLSAGGYVVLAANALELPHLAAKERVQLINTVPSAIKMLHETGGLPATVRTINLAGEALKQSLVDDLYATGHVQQVYDLYGPSEDTTYSTFTLRAAHGKANIGRPIANSSVYLLSDAVAPVPVGVNGELYMAGAGLARGYLGRPGLTAERFIPDPFDEQGGGRMYRTGDLARYQAGGLIEYVGRIDHQVKIRGFRIELGEIEARLQAHETVREAVLLAQDGPSGKQLVGYVVPVDEALTGTPAQQSSLRDALRSRLKQNLPEYMVPAQLLFLAKLPLTPNGKLDRKALPQPDVSHFQASHVAPRSELEREIAAVWASVLKLEKVGITDNFFELGGDSIISLQVVSRARQAGVQFTPKQLFQYQTVQGLASVARLADNLAIDQGVVTGSMPLTPVQHWFFDQAITRPHHFNQSVLLAPSEQIDAQRLSAALGCVLQHHDALRLGFDQVAGQWQGTFLDVDAHDVLWDRSVDDIEALSRLADEAQASFTLCGPLLRAVLVTLADGAQRLLLVVHHLVVDGVSWRVLLEDLQGAYQFLAAGQPVALPAKTSSFKAWAEQVQRYGKSDDLAQELAYWQDHLCDADDALPVDNPQGGNLQRDAAYASSHLDAQWTHKLLHEAPAAYRTQINDLLLTALARVISRWTGRSQVLVRLEGHGREDVFDQIDLTRTVGWFTSIYPVKLDVQPQLDSTIKTIKEQLRAVPDKGIGYGLLRYMGSDESQDILAQLPKGEIVFNYLGQFDGSFADENTLFRPAREYGGANQSEDAALGSLLALNGQVYAGELKMGWTFSRELFDESTIQRLAQEYVEELKQLISYCCDARHHGMTPSDFPLAALNQAQLDSLPIDAAQVADIYPLSPMQQGMLFHTLYEQNAGNYINQLRVDVEGLQVEPFKQAWQAALQAHGILRTGFIWEGDLDQAVQVVCRSVALPFEEHDWRGQPAREHALQALAEGERQRGFPLDAAPLLRLVLVRTGADQYHFIYTHHHILMDGWSTSRLLGEVLQRYTGNWRASSTTHYRDYIGWLQRQDGNAAETFWKGQLANLQQPTRLAQAVRLPVDGRPSGHAALHDIFDREQTARIEAFARTNRVTVNTLVQSAWMLLLQRYTGQDTVCFGATVAGRPADLPGVEEQIGLFINTLPVVGSPRSEQTVGQWINQVQANNLAMRELEHTPLYEIQRWAGAGGEALFDNILVFENYPVSEALQQGAPSGLRFGEVDNVEQTNYPLSVAVGLGNVLSIRYTYDRALWNEIAIQGVAGHLRNVLQALVEDANRPVSELPLLDEQQQRLVVEQWNRCQPTATDGLSVSALIEAQVARTPQAQAVRFADESLTYQGLNDRANQLAHELRALGVGPDVLVGIAMERGLDLVVGLLAILKAGGAYVPMDPEYPRERLTYMLEDSGVHLLLTNHACQAKLPVPDQVECVLVDHGALRMAEAPGNLPNVTEPGNLAYMIYTSGSTGRPKGAGIDQQALCSRLLWMQAAYALGEDDVVLQKTSFSFDVSVWELLWPLTCGARLLLSRQGDQRDPALLIELIRTHGVTTLHFIPSMLRNFLEAEGLAQCHSLKRLFSGGEALSSDLLNKALECLPHVQIYNRYGPVEATINATHSQALSARNGDVEIGNALPDTRILILDAGLQPVPVGVCGELYIGGKALARGYHRKALLSAERFVPDPFAQHSGDRLYRTGDLARYRVDGAVEYVGRIDHQVKIRGFRIELGEIEACLQEHASVLHAVVVAQPGPQGHQLVGYVVPAPSAGPEIDDGQLAELRDALRSILKASLPDYMVPTHLMFLQQLPLSPNGKLDRKALPQPDASLLQADYVAPQSQLEKQLAAIWADVLKLEKVGLTDNFFELGGDSIISLQVVSRARLAGVQFTPKELFEHQTVQALAAVARRSTGLVIDQGPVTGSMPLTPVQRRFFAVEIPARHHWNQSVLLRPGAPLDMSTLTTALQALLDHHDALRLRFECTEGDWSAHFAPQQAQAVIWQRALESVEQLHALANEAQRSLSLEHGPMLRVLLVTLPDASQRLLLAIHHLVVDGVSWRVLLEDLQQAYQAVNAGQPVKLPAKTSAFKAWSQRLHAYAGSAELQREMAYWQASLQGIGSAPLPVDHAAGRNLAKYATSVATQLDPTYTRQLLQEAPAAYRTQINDLLLTALARVVARWIGQPEVVIRLEGHGREDLFDDIDVTRTVGWFTSIYPVKLKPITQMAASIKAVKEQLRAVPDKGVGYGVLRYLGGEEQQRALELLPQGDIVFNYLGQFDGSFADEAAFLVPATERCGEGQDENTPLSSLLAINGQVYAGELKLSWTFSREVFEESTVQYLADELAQELKAVITHCCKAEHHGVTPSDFPLAGLTQAQLDSLPLPAAEIADVYPLAPMQQGMLFHTLFDQQAGNYINQLRVDVHGLDVQRFKQAWQATFDAHDILRTGFLMQGELDQAVQVVRKTVELPFSEHDWRGQPALEQALQALAEGERQRGFDLAAAPLLRLVLVRTGDDSHQLIYTNHHILMDGWSTSRLLGEVLQRYAGVVPQAQATHYRDYIAWLQGQDAAVAEAFWKAQLASLDEPTRLAQAIAGSAGAGGSGYGDRRLAFDREQTARIEAFARANRVTVNTLVQSAWLLLLQRCTGQASVCFGATVAGRPADLPGVEEQIGLFINTLPVIGAPRAEQTVAEWIGQVQAGNLAVREFEHTPLYDVQRWAGQGGDALFDSILVFENYPVSEALQQGAPGGLRFGEVAVQEQTNYPLTLVVELGATLSMQYSHDRTLWSDDTIDCLAGYFSNLLEALTENADALVGELPMLAQAERQLMIEGWNHTQAAYPNERSIHSLIEAQVFATPDAPALVFGEQALSYAELNRRANQLAHKLRELGVGPDALVGIAMERSLEMVIGLLGIVKAGGAYVPLDPEYPQDRLAYMFEDSGIALLLTQSHLRDNLPIPAGLRSLDLDVEDLSGFSDANPAVDVAPLNLAYVIYTSGSTGRPKGAGNSHQALVNRLWWMQKAYGLDASDSVLQKTPFSFDVSVWEFFWPLMTGARLVVAQPGAHRDPQLLVDTINHHGISTLHFVPSMLQAFMTHEAVESCTTLKRVVCSGEALPAELARQTLQRLPAAGLYNLYGPTEAAIDVTHWTCQPDESISVPIGQPIDNLKTHILEGSLQPAVRGSAGELYLGGVGLARGYHQRPSLTAERFVPDPFSDNGGRLYRTGDLARYRADGVIDYAGRIDHQVKIRGLRIELGEIEARLLELPSVQEAVVLAQDGPSGKQLVGYVVPVDNTQDESALRDSLREALKAGLPDYMVPAHLLLLDKLPVTPNGKLDRKALPQPDASQLQGEYVAPQSELEQQLAAIWADVLKLERVGLTDNFFELGGDSIISLQVVSRARLQDIQFTPKELFENQTVQRLAAIARRNVRSAVDQGKVSGSMPLTPIQQWFFAEDIPQRQHWNQSVLLQPSEILHSETLGAALSALVEHHDALRLSFDQSESGWHAAFKEAPQALLWTRSVTDASQLSLVTEQAQRSLNLEQGPLLRAVLIDLADGGQRLLLVIHHLVVDGVSWRVLLADLQQVYLALRDGQPLNLPEKTSSFKAWGQQLRDYAASPQLVAQMDYWQAQLQGTSDALPCDNPQGGNLQKHAASVSSCLDRERTRQLLQVAPAAYRTQINDLLLTALARVVCRWTAHPQLLVRMEGHGREDLFEGIDLSRTVGWFTSMYPVNLHPQRGMGDSIKAIKEQLRAVPDKGMGYGLLRYLGDEQARNTLVQLPHGEVVFNYLGQFDGSFDASSALFVPAKEYPGAPQDKSAPLASMLTINGQVYGGELKLNWSFSRDRFAPATLQRLADDYVTELNALIEHCCLQQHTGVTPSDFPLAGLNQSQLDSLPVPVQQVADIYPLSPMQQGMLFYTLQGSESGLYINQTSVEVAGLEIDRFITAWNQVIVRHDILRTGFWLSPMLAEPLQVVHRQAELPTRVLDWRGREVSTDDLQALAADETAQGFDLMSAPLMRLTLVRLDDERLHLIWTRHHILMDGWSNSRLLGEVLQCYHGQGSSVPVTRFAEYIRWLARQPQAALQAFWSGKLRELESPTLLAGTVAPYADSKLEGHDALYLHWDAAKTSRLRQQAQRLRVTPNTLIQAAWLLLLQRYTGQSSVCFGATVAGRPAGLAGSDEMLGLFINTLPVVQAPQPDVVVSDWLQQLQAYNLELRDHEHAALADVQRWAGQPGQALFDSIVVFENYPVDERLRESADSTLRFGEVSNRDVTNFAMDLAVHLSETLSVEFLYLRSRFTQAATDAIRGSFESLLTAMLDNPRAAIGSLGMLTSAQVQQTVARNRLPAGESSMLHLAGQVARHAFERPHALAVSCGEQVLTYAELDHRANRLAHHLTSLGARPEVTVGIALERSVDVIVAFLAVMKTGAAYVPLDIDYPQDRLQWIVEDSAMHLLVTSSGLRERFAQVRSCVELDLLTGLELPDSAPQVQVQDDNLAYLIYTSGSTGKPKGVAVSHGQIRMHCQAIAQLYEMDTATRELLFMSFAFDGAQERWLSTLSSGGSLVVRDNRLWTAEETWQVLHAQRIDIACFPPAYLQQLAEFAEASTQAAPPVRIYCFGGDAVPDALFELVKRTLRPQYLTNGYGPTETVVTPLLWKVSAQQSCEAVYAPIGERVGLRTLHVLDQDLNPLPDGVAGELYIGGEGVARGYHQRPALTAERFVADPFNPGSRLYRTGDRVRRRANGVIDFIGRLDNQLKVRGFRIEPGEIEARLRNLPDVKDAVVVAREVANGKQLVGYVVSANAMVMSAQLRDAMRAELPDYMVPAHVVLLASMPLTPNGKIDRNALPAPEATGQRKRVAPRNDIERVLARIWQEVLEVDQVGVDDNFFELGGDSLRVLKMLSKVRAHEDLPIELKLRDVMAKPTIGELSGFTIAGNDLDPLLLLNSRVADATPLFCLHAGFGTVFDYEPLARRLDGHCSVYGLQCRMFLDRDWEDDSLESMAIDYAQYIRQKQPEGPYRLMGWSLGGSLAVMVARELENQGQQVAALGLVDSFMPKPEVVPAEGDWGNDLRGFLSVVLGIAKEQLPAGVVPVDTEAAALEQMVQQWRADHCEQSAYADISSGELAHTFVVAMRLKALSSQISGLPSTSAQASCWWAGDTVSPYWTRRSTVNVAINAGHYDILKHPEVIDGLVTMVQEVDKVSD